jgi:hypothetical protein
MPAYFSLVVSFDKIRLYPNFVKDIYNIMFENGFGFKSGYWNSENDNLEKIISWNQKLLEKGFRLGYKQNVKNDYKQVLFNTDLYSELRAYWLCYKDEIIFRIIILEADMLEYEGGNFFIEEKLDPIKNLAKSIWNSGTIDLIQTCLEEDENISLSEFLTGTFPHTYPFSIAKKSLLFIDNNKYETVDIKNDGIFISLKGF